VVERVGAVEDLEIAVAVEVGGQRDVDRAVVVGRDPQGGAEVIDDVVAGEDLDVTIVVEVGQRDRDLPGREDVDALLFDRSVVLEGDEMAEASDVVVEVVSPAVAVVEDVVVEVTSLVAVPSPSPVVGVPVVLEVGEVAAPMELWPSLAEVPQVANSGIMAVR
jgi:hypothetical protein